jgi:hypothetical protein
LIDGIQTNLTQPVFRGVITSLLIQPVAIKNREVDVLADLGVQGFKDGYGWTCTITPASLVVATGKFKFEIKETLRVAFWVLKVCSTWQGAEGAIELMVSDAVIIAGIGLQPVDGDDSRVIAFDISRFNGCLFGELIFLRAVKNLDLAWSLSTHPEAHGIGLWPAEHWTVCDTDYRWFTVFGRQEIH